MTVRAGSEPGTREASAGSAPRAAGDARSSSSRADRNAIRARMVNRIRAWGATGSVICQAIAGLYEELFRHGHDEIVIILKIISECSEFRKFEYAEDDMTKLFKPLFSIFLFVAAVTGALSDVGREPRAGHMQNSGYENSGGRGGPHF